uniref:N-acetylneuraminate lyase n=1 Tax=Ciona savignyi TaxID=51511 RepID=H2ZKQ1_CIOSA
MKNPNLKGLIAAPFSPMLENGDLNFAILDDYVDYLVTQGVCSVYVNGTTGEGLSLSFEERKLAAEKWVQAGKGKLKSVIIQVGSCSLRDTKALAKHAAAKGADVIATLPPFFFKPKTIGLLVDYLAEVAAEVPDVPFMYYHIPEMTGVHFDMAKLMKEAADRIPNFGGLKFTSLDLSEFGRCSELFGDQLTICYSKDEQVSGAYMLGATAAVGSTYNYCGKLNNKIIDACMNGDFKTAGKLQKKVTLFIGVLLDYGLDVAINKAVMTKLSGLDMGPSRLPLAPVSAQTVENITKDLKKIEFFDWGQ